MTRPFAQIYVACALTNVSDGSRRTLKKDCAAIIDAVQQAAGNDAWRVVAYDPITHTPPWEPEGRAFSAEDVWAIDTAKVLEEADGIIIHGFQGGSSGVGIELAFAFARGIPILYVHHDTCDVSRMIHGMPGFIEVAPFFEAGEDDRSELRRVVTEWLQRWRPVIEDGPIARDGLARIFERLHRALLTSWNELSHERRIEAAWIARMMVSEASEYLRSPVRLASMPAHKLLLLGTALELNVPGLIAASWRPPPLSDPELRALSSAAEEYEWGPQYVALAENVARGYKNRRLLQADEEGLVARHGSEFNLGDSSEWIRIMDDFRRGHLS